MIKLESFDLTPKSLGKVIERWKSSQLPRLKLLWEHYDKKISPQDLAEAGKKQKRKLAAAYAQYIVRIQTGYFVGIPIKYAASEEEYLEQYNAVLEDNFEEDVNYEMAKCASIYGYGAELVYQNEKSQTKIKRLDPKELILVFGTRMDQFLLAAIRYYTTQDLEGNTTEMAEVYQETEQIVRRFTKGKDDKDFVEDRQGSSTHPFAEIPIILYLNNEEMTSDFEHILTGNEAYNTAQSNTANDVDYLQDAYLVISGANDLAEEGEEGAEEGAPWERTRKKLAENKVFFFPDGGDAKFLVKNLNDSASENYKNRLNQDIHKFAMTPDLADEKFAGNLSGIAIRFKTIPLEQSAKARENKFRVGLRKRRELITQILNALHGKAWDYRSITEIFSRNLPMNTAEETQTVLSMADYVSRRTLLELLPQIEDADEELKRLEEEKEEYDQRDYDFSLMREGQDKEGEATDSKESDALESKAKPVFLEGKEEQEEKPLRK